jgi:hypothetical protein
VFDDIKGLEGPVRGRRKTIDGHTYLYFVNAEPYTVGLKFALSSSPEKITDLAKLRSSKTSSRVIKLKMLPYSLRALKLANSAVATNGATFIPPEEIKKLNSDLTKYKKLFIGKRINPPERRGKNYIWLEAENWVEWNVKKKTSSRNSARRKEYRNIKNISGDNDIALVSDQNPPMYNITIPKTGKYTFWVRFTITSAKQFSKWRIEANDSLLELFKTPVGAASNWVKAGSAEFKKGKLSFKLKHLNKNHSYSIDSFLITDDENYVPKGLADHHEKDLKLKKIMDLIKEAQKKHNTAKMRTYINLLRMLSEGIKPKR